MFINIGFVGTIIAAINVKVLAINNVEVIKNNILSI